MCYDFSIKKRNYEIKIVSNIEIKDNKSFSISCEFDSLYIYNIVNHFCNYKLDKLLIDDINFINTKKIRRESHEIQIHDIKNKKTKSFRIDYKNFSSKEIANEIHKYICGGKEIE